MIKISKHSGLKLNFILLALFCFIGILSLPIGYFTFLRITTTLGSVLAIVLLYKRQNWIFLSVFVFLAFLFNPIVPIYLIKKGLWLPLDILAGAAFLFIAFFSPAQNEAADQPNIDNPATRKTLVRDRIVTKQKSE
jgi:hypothetical protein